MDRVLRGHPIIAGTATGDVLISKEPISFWGGVDPETGQLIDRRHDRCGASIAGRIFAFPEEKGSSTASAVLVELVRNGHPPAAIVTCSVVPILALGSIVAGLLYGIEIPIVRLSELDLYELIDGERVTVFEDGTLRADPACGAGARQPL